MTDRGVTGRRGAGAIRVDNKRTGSAMMAILFLLCGSQSTFAAIGGKASLHGGDLIWSVLLFSLSALFALPALSALVNLLRGFTRRGFAFDEQGFYVWRGSARALVRWDDIASLSVSFESPPRTTPVTIEGVASDAIVDSLIKDHRRMALDIVPVSPDATRGSGLLARYRVGDHWRVPLFQLPEVVKPTIHGARTFAGPRWRGLVERPWTGGIFRSRRGRPSGTSARPRGSVQ